MSMYTKLHVDHRSYYIWFLNEHLIISYACWVDIYAPILNGSLRFSGMRSRVLWLSVAFLWFLVVFRVASCGSLCFCGFLCSLSF